MARLNRDTIIALILLIVCGVLMMASYEIREPDYGQLSPAAWPRAVIVAMTVLALIYLIQSVQAGPDTPNADAPRGVVAFLAYWQNVIWCFVIFLGYLLALPYVGMLIGGLVFAFVLLTALGGWSPRSLGLHAIIALCSVGGMWLLFTQALGVFLPRGEWTGF